VQIDKIRVDIQPRRINHLPALRWGIAAATRAIRFPDTATSMTRRSCWLDHHTAALNQQIVCLPKALSTSELQRKVRLKPDSSFRGSCNHPTHSLASALGTADFPQDISSEFSI
jgi:hypothetical protein